MERQWRFRHHLLEFAPGTLAPKHSSPRSHLEVLRQVVGNVYPNKFERSQIVEAGREDTITSIAEKFRGFEPRVSEDERPAAEEIELANRQLNQFTVRLAGRIASPPRVMGK